MYYGKVEICGVNTAKLKTLTAKETQELLIRAKAGDTKARDELIYGNLRLVLSVLRRFAGRGELMDDLFQVGCIGLVKAVDNFNVELGVRFSTYAVPMIVECRDNRKESLHDKKTSIEASNSLAFEESRERRGY